MNFKTTPLTPIEKQKVSQDLQFIKSFAIATAPTHCRLIVAGGYAVDGNLGQITRPHRDLDLQLFGQTPKAVELVTKIFQKLLDNYPSLTLSDEGKTEYYHLFKITDNQELKVELYFIQTLESPFESPKITVKKDGSSSEPGEYDTVVANMEDVIYESLSPSAVLKDLTSKAKEGESPKYTQDIYNLNLLLHS